MKLATTTEDFNRFAPDYESRIRLLHEAGFRHIDLSMYVLKGNDELMLDDNWRENARRIKSFASSLGMDFVQAHSPGGNPLMQDDRFDTLLSSTIRSIEICGILGIPHTVVHAGHAKGISKEEYFERNLAFYRLLFPVMEATGVSVLVENSTKANMGDQYYVNSGADLAEFLRYAGHPLLHACWDTGHANCEGTQYDEIMALGDELRGVHINDNRGGGDEHLLPWMGTMNLDDIMHGLIDSGYKGSFTFESCSALRPAKYWQGNRRAYKADTRLAEPTLGMQKHLEALMYEMGTHILTSYGIEAE